ncbi:MAG: amino acid racemase [Clostridiales bacterium]|nr:amino acid racemase [Clostridiales bacterium]
MNNMVIGIIGGMGSYATVNFFKRLVDAFPGEKEWDRPRIILDNYCTMPSRVRAILYNENRNELVKDLSTATEHMIQCGVDYIVLACNTSHVFLPDIISNVPDSETKFINIIDSCAKELHEKKIARCGLIATEGTLDTCIYQSVFDGYSIAIDAPTKEQYGEIRYFIESVKQNKISEEVIDAFAKFIESFQNNYVILGCTELPILYQACVERGCIPNKKICDPLQSTIKQLVSCSNKFIVNQ